MKLVIPMASLVVVLVSSHARADERQPTLAVGGLLNVGESPEGGVGGVRATLSFEHAPIDYPAERGYAFDVSIVPELVVGALLTDVEAEGHLGVGARLDLRMAQRDMGLFKVSARGGFYVGAHALVHGDQHRVSPELTFGEYVYAGRSSKTRFGIECDVDVDGNDVMNSAPESTGVTLQLYLGRSL